VNELYLIKFKPERSSTGRLLGDYGLKGHCGPQSWKRTVELIAEEGIGQVEYVKHHDKDPKNYGALEGKEMLRLCQAVAKAILISTPPNVK
jgi:hypothetical protein